MKAKWLKRLKETSNYYDIFYYGEMHNNTDSPIRKRKGNEGPRECLIHSVTKCTLWQIIRS